LLSRKGSASDIFFYIISGKFILVYFIFISLLKGKKKFYKSVTNMSNALCKSWVEQNAIINAEKNIKKILI
jgi:hypothetical protein